MQRRLSTKSRDDVREKFARQPISEPLDNLLTDAPAADVEVDR